MNLPLLIVYYVLIPCVFKSEDKVKSEIISIELNVIYLSRLRKQNVRSLFCSIRMATHYLTLFLLLRGSKWFGADIVGKYERKKGVLVLLSIFINMVGVVCLL